MATYSPKAGEIKREWHLIDAEGMVLGRLATEAARLLRGKHKPVFTSHLDVGDHVVIVNADKIVLTSDKANRKMLYRHSGYPGGLSSETYGAKMSRDTAQAVRDTIRGMLPKTRLGRAQILKLKIYSGGDHPHAAQQPSPYGVPHAYAARSSK